MGVGKTSVGEILAKQLNCDCFDLDKLVSQQDPDGRECGAILTQFGEPTFRSLEFRALNTWAQTYSSERSVLSLGGGAVLHPGVRELLEGQEFWVGWLKADPEVLAERLWATGTDSRPFVADIGSRSALVERLSALCEARTRFYSESSDAEFDTTGSTPETVAGAIYAEISGLMP